MCSLSLSLSAFDRCIDPELVGNVLVWFTHTKRNEIPSKTKQFLNVHRWCRNRVAVRSCAARWRTRRRSSGWTSAWSSTLKTSSRFCSTRRIVRSFWLFQFFSDFHHYTNIWRLLMYRFSLLWLVWGRTLYYQPLGFASSVNIFWRPWIKYRVAWMGGYKYTIQGNEK